MAAICVFCGSRSGEQPEFGIAATHLGAELVRRGHTLVYGGGSVGLMGTLADSVLLAGGQVVGVIPQALANVELMHDGVADMRIVPDMHARKAMMHQLSDGYLALPGGYGTMEELFEALCWAQLEFHSRPVAVWNVNGYYDGMRNLMRNMVQQHFLSDHHHSILSVIQSESELAEWLSAF